MSLSVGAGVGADVYYDALVAGLRRGQLYKYVNVATLTVFVVDYIATFDFEIEYMWPLKLNLVSVLFLLTRYLPVLDMTVTLYTEHATNMTQPLCSSLARTYVWLIYVGMAVAEGLLMLRVWALCGKGRKLLVFLLAVYSGSFLASGIKIYFSLKTLQVLVVMIPLPSQPVVCYTKSYDQQLYLYWVFMIIVDAVSCVLLLMELASAYRIGGLTNLMRLVYRDGAIFYVVLLCFSVINIFAIVTLTPDISSLLTAPERIIHAVFASRVVLHTRHQVHQDKQISLNTIPSINAAHPEQFSHASAAATRISFSGTYTSPISITIPRRISLDVRLSPSSSGGGGGGGGGGGVVRPIRTVSSPTDWPLLLLSPSSDSSSSPTSPGGERWISAPSSPVVSETVVWTDSTAVEAGGARNTTGGGPIFEAAMERQRQRQYAKIRRSLREAHRSRRL